MTSNLRKIADEMKLLNQFFAEDLPAIDAAMPFDLVPSKPLTAKQKIEVAGMKLPKRFSLTQGEVLVLAEIWERIGEDMSYATLKIAIASVLLMFRFNCDWTVEASFQLSGEALDDIFQYYSNERLAWKAEEVAPPADEAEDDAPKQPAKKQRSSGRSPTIDSSKPSPETADTTQTTLRVIA